MSTSKVEVHFIVLEALKCVAKVPVEEELPDATHLFNSGILNSLGFMGLIVSLETQLNIQIDFSDLEPSEFLTLGGFKALIAKGLLNK